jgi:hypothetical protein
MSLNFLSDLRRLVLQPGEFLGSADRGRPLIEGVAFFGLSIAVSIAVAEIGALAPFRQATGLGASFPLAPQYDLHSDPRFQDNRFLYSPDLALVAILFWLSAAFLVHAFARGLLGRGSFTGYLKLVGFIAALNLLLLPFYLLETALRFSTADSARDLVGSGLVVLEIAVLGWQLVLLAVAARIHYRLNTAGAATAVSMSVATAVLASCALLLVLMLWVAIILAKLAWPG